MKTKHLVMNIEGLELKLESLNNYQSKNRYCKECFEMTFGQVKKALQEYKDKGYVVIPGGGCTNINPDGSCGC